MYRSDTALRQRPGFGRGASSSDCDLSDDRKCCKGRRNKGRVASDEDDELETVARFQRHLSSPLETLEPSRLPKQALLLVRPLTHHPDRILRGVLF